MAHASAPVRRVLVAFAPLAAGGCAMIGDGGAPELSFHVDRRPPQLAEHPYSANSGVTALFPIDVTACPRCSSRLW